MWVCVNATAGLAPSGLYLCFQDLSTEAKWRNLRRDGPLCEDFVKHGVTLKLGTFKFCRQDGEREGGEGGKEGGKEGERVCVCVSARV